MTPWPPSRAIVLALALAAALVACGDASQPGTQRPAPAGTSVATPVPSHPSDLSPVGETETARVVRVVDGDTIIIDRGRGNERLRYIGIDAPESVKPDTPVEFMGKEASAANEAMVGGRELVLERDVSETDRFGRLLRYAWIQDGDAWLFVNLELIRSGFAHAVTFPPDVRWTDTFREAQREARDADRGLWGRATPAP